MKNSNQTGAVFLLIVVAALLGIINAAAILECPPHSTFNGCMTRCPKTCQNIDHPATACISACSVGCECLEGFVKVNKGPTSQCVKQYECPMYSPKAQTLPYPMLRKLAAAASVPSMAMMNLTSITMQRPTTTSGRTSGSTLAVLRKVKNPKPEENESPEQ